MADPLLVDDDGAVRTLTLDRPEARNALSGDLVRALPARVARIHGGTSEVMRTIISKSLGL
ncbi:hypothetical protein [Blastococcus sp. SYSU DS0539]